MDLFAWRSSGMLSAAWTSNGMISAGHGSTGMAYRFIPSHFEHWLVVRRLTRLSSYSKVAPPRGIWCGRSRGGIAVLGLLCVQVDMWIGSELSGLPGVARFVAALFPMYWESIEF